MPLQPSSDLVLKRQHQRAQQTSPCSPVSPTWSWAKGSSPEQGQTLHPAVWWQTLVAGLLHAVTDTGSQEWLRPADVATSPWTSELKVLEAKSWLNSGTHIWLALIWALVTQALLSKTQVFSAVRTAGILLFPTTNRETEAKDGRGW